MVSKLIMNDTEAVKLAVQGREDGFRAIFVNHSSFLFTHALRILKNRHQAEDAVQEAFAAAFRAIGNFRGEAKLRTWLYQILYRSALKIVSQKTEQPAKDSDKNVVSESGATELRLDINEVLERLPERDRAILIMTYWDEMPLKETAQVLEVTENNAKIILFRARNRFADLWQQANRKEADSNEM